MAVLSVIVARGQIVLAQHTVATADAATVDAAVDAVLAEAAAHPTDTRLSVAAGGAVFHVLRAHGVVLVCAADVSDGREMPFAVLDAVATRVAPHATHAKSAPVFGLNSLAPTLATCIKEVSSQPRWGAARAVTDDLAEVRDVMLANVDLVLQRGDNIRILVAQTDELATESAGFRHRASAVRRGEWWRSMRLKFIIGGIIATIIFVTVALLVLTLRR